MIEENAQDDFLSTKLFVKSEPSESIVNFPKSSGRRHNSDEENGISLVIVDEDRDALIAGGFRDHLRTSVCQRTMTF